MSKMLTLASERAPIAEYLISALREHGYHVLKSFDLKSARVASLEEGLCPRHHALDCDCQYMVLIIYPAQGGSPRTIILHELEGAARVTLDDPDGALTTLLLKLAT